MAKSKVVIKREAAAKLPKSASEVPQGAFLRGVRRGRFSRRVAGCLPSSRRSHRSLTFLVMRRLAGLVSEWRGTLSVPRNLKLGLLHPPLA